MPGLPRRYKRPSTKKVYTSDIKFKGSRHERGYDSKWDKLRNYYIGENPLCEHCKAAGTARPAQDVDHIIPFQGKDDPLRLDPDNLQALCRPCHNKKSKEYHAKTKSN